MNRRRALKWLAGALLVLLGLGLAGLRRDRPASEVEARRAATPSKFMVVDGLRMHYRDRGQGPVVVLLHGSNSSLFTWEGWVAALSSDHRVVTLDLPGHGLTGPDAKNRYSSGEMAEVVDRFLTQLGVTRFTIGGNSMGGAIAWHYALAHPDKVERLILVDAAGWPREEPPPFGLRLFSSPLLGRLARWITPRFLVARSVRDTYGNPQRVTEAIIDLYDDFLLREGNREATRRRLSSGVDDGLSSHLAELRVPTLILWGTRDRWILPRYAERFHATIAGSRLVMLDGLGHIPMEEDPAASVAPVRDFLR
jgi:pimeloyl-ACP methyl ester carboxylesterase